MIYVFVAVFLSIYGALNFYIGYRGLQAFNTLMPSLSKKVYWIIFSIIAVSYIIGKFCEKFIPRKVSNFFTITGSYWMAALLYFTLILIIIELVLIADRHAGFIPSTLKAQPWTLPILGFTVLGVVLGLLVYGTVNARNPKIAPYDLVVDKKAGTLEELRVAMFSDTHLGYLVDKARLEELVETLQRLDPDLILVPGDIIDDNIEPFVKQNMSESFKKLSPRFGIFAVTGNHEYYGGQSHQAVDILEKAGIQVLNDGFVKVADSFYIVGRTDPTMEKIAGRKRKDLEEIMEGIDKSLPILLMDHQPKDLDEARTNGVDLQLSGHTHAGQLFPIGLITDRIFEIDWGYLKKDNLHVIVSSGYGTWGPPIRIGNTPELVDITLRFKSE